VLEELIQRGRRNAIRFSWVFTILVGIFFLAVFVFLVLCPIIKGVNPGAGGNFIFGILFSSIFAAMIVLVWLGLPGQLKRQREQFAQVMANKERLEQEFANIKALVGQQGDDSKIKEIATRSSRWGWGAAVHNLEFPGGSYPELRVDYKNHTF